MSGEFPEVSTQIEQSIRIGSGGLNPTCELPKGHDGPHDPIAL